MTGLALLAFGFAQPAAAGVGDTYLQRIELGGTWDFAPAANPVDPAKGVPRIGDWDTIAVPGKAYPSPGSSLSSPGGRA